MIAINRTKFDLYDKSKNKPKNAKHFINYKDEFYTSGKFTYPISIFLDILDSYKKEMGYRYLLKEEDGSYLLFLPPYESPVKLSSLDKDALRRIHLFSSGLETVNFVFEGLGKTDSDDILKTLKKMPKVTSRYGFVYLGMSIALVYVVASGITNSVMGIFQTKVDEKQLILMEQNSKLSTVQTELLLLEQQLKPNGTNGLNLQLPTPVESFSQRASRGAKLEQDDVITVLEKQEEEL